MLAENPEIIDLNVYHLDNLFKMVLASREIKPFILILYEDDRILKIIHSQRGLLEERGKWEGQKTLKDFYNKEIDFIYAIELKNFRKIGKLFQEKVYYDENYIFQLFILLKIISKEFNKTIFHYPDKISKLKYFINYNIANRIFNFLMPRNCYLVFVIFSGEEIFSSFVIGIKNSEISLISNLDIEWKDKELRRNYINIINYIEKKFGKVFLGVFFSKDSFGKNFFKNYKNGEIIINPCSFKFKLLLFFGKIFLS